MKARSPHPTFAGRARRFVPVVLLAAAAVLAAGTVVAARDLPQAAPSATRSTVPGVSTSLVTRGSSWALKVRTSATRGSSWS